MKIGSPIDAYAELCVVRGHDVGAVVWTVEPGSDYCLGVLVAGGYGVTYHHRRGTAEADQPNKSDPHKVVRRCGPRCAIAPLQLF